MNIKYIIGTKDKKWFFRYHSADVCLLTKHPGSACGVDEEYKEQLNIQNMIDNVVKFIDCYGSDIDKPFDEIVGIDLKFDDFCIFKLETKVEYNLEQQ